MNLSTVQHATTLAGAIAILCMCEGGSALGMQAARDAKAPPPSAAGASIAGAVVTADSARPVRRATVTLTALEPRSARTVQTDDQGAFRFSGLPAGEYTLKASKGGYVESIYGQRQPGSGRPGVPIRLAADQQVSRLSVPLPRGGVITGVILDETGEPAFGISVRALRWSMQSGVRSVSPAGSAVTDDRGVYRIHSLVPGEYLVSASANTATISLFANEGVAYTKMLGDLEATLGDRFVIRGNTEGGPAPTAGFATVYYPGTTIGSAASSVTIGPAEERPGIDITLQIVPLARIAGVVTSLTGPASATSVQLIDSTNMLFGGARTARTDGAGRFAFEGVAPGQYTLVTKGTAKGAAQLEASGREAAEFLAATTDKAKIQAISSAISAVAPLWATTDVVVDGRNQTDINLLLQPGLTVSGQIAFDAGAQPASVSRLTVGLTPVGAIGGDFAQTGPATVDASGQFTVRGVMPGRYRIAVLGGMPAGYHLYSAVFRGQDILDVPLEIDGSASVSGGIVTLSNRPTEISGVVQNVSGRVEPGFTVIVFPSEERLWTPGARRIQATRPANDGRYQFRNLPPGDYRLIAVPDVEPGRWFDPAFLRQLAGFASITLGAGARHTQDFQIR